MRLWVYTIQIQVFHSKTLKTKDKMKQVGTFIIENENKNVSLNQLLWDAWSNICHNPNSFSVWIRYLNEKDSMGIMVSLHLPLAIHYLLFHSCYWCHWSQEHWFITLVGLHQGHEQFVYFISLLFISVFLVEGLMMIIASMVPNFLMGIVFGSGILGVMMLDGGFYRLPSDIPKPFWKYPLHYISFH